jgi:hypothetical protein
MYRLSENNLVVDEWGQVDVGSCILNTGGFGRFGGEALDEEIAVREKCI